MVFPGARSRSAARGHSNSDAQMVLFASFVRKSPPSPLHTHAHSSLKRTTATTTPKTKSTTYSKRESLVGRSPPPARLRSAILRTRRRQLCSLAVSENRTHSRRRAAGQLVGRNVPSLRIKLGLFFSLLNFSFGETSPPPTVSRFVSFAGWP